MSVTVSYKITRCFECPEFCNVMGCSFCREDPVATETIPARTIEDPDKIPVWCPFRRK